VRRFLTHGVEGAVSQSDGGGSSTHWDPATLF